MQTKKIGRVHEEIFHWKGYIETDKHIKDAQYH